MSSVYDQAAEFVLGHEGGFVDDPDDPGGATKYGISLRFLKSIGDLDLDGDGFSDFDLDRDGDIDADDIRLLTRAKAKDIYRIKWWDKFNYDRFDGRIATKVFDLAVNMGSRSAHRCLQRALRANQHDISDDGIIGNQTMEAYETVYDAAFEVCLLPALCSEAGGFYRYLIGRRPTFQKYENGWLRRAYAWPPTFKETKA